MPCDYSKYPANWKTEIRPRILERSKTDDGIEKCEWCGVPNRRQLVNRESRVVLTIAHLNHDTTDNRDENLAALCQRCHLTYDAKFHATNASATRDRKRGQSRMNFEDTTEPNQGEPYQ